MSGYLGLFIALVVEAVLLLLIFIVIVVGVLGIFLPILPGIFLIGAGVGLYSLMVKKNYGAVTPRLHRFLVARHDSIVALPLVRPLMNMMNAFKKNKKIEYAREQILKYGLILLGLNMALVIALVLSTGTASIISRVVHAQGLVVAFLPLLIIFIFAGVSAIVWYRFGMIIGARLKKQAITNAALIVLISYLPMVALMILFSGILNIVGAFEHEPIVFLFLAFMLMSVYGAVFELIVVSFGMMTRSR